MKNRENRKKRMKRAFAACLALLTAVSLAACGSGGEEDGSGEQAAAGDRFVYVPEFVSTGEGNERISNVIGAGGKLYYSRYIWDEATQTSSQPLFAYDIATEEETELKVDAEALEHAYINRMAADNDGNLYVIWSRSVIDENNPENWHQDTLLAKYTATGENTFLQDITQDMMSDEENSYVQEMVVDAEGRIYLGCSNLIRLYDGEGNSRGTVDLNDNWINSAVQGKDGKVYITYYDRSGGEGGYVIVEVDFDGRKLGNSTYSIPGNISSLSMGLEKDFLINDNSRLYEYDLESGTMEELLNWVNCDINGDYIQFLCPTGDGRLLAVLSDWETNQTELAFLTKTKASEVVQKEELVLGVLYQSQETRSAVVAFNKSNEKYHISIKEYYDSNSDMDYETAYETALTNLNNELSSGKGPDILALDGNIDSQLLAGKGLLADLYPYLDKSSAFSRDTFVENVLRCCTYDDMLISIPKTFAISAVAGKTSLVGDKMGWSVQDIIDFAAEHPGAELFEYASQGEMMQTLMTFNQDAFIDWEKGTCSFDSEEFRQILEFVKSFPEEFNWDGERENTPNRLSADKLLLYTDSINDPKDIQVAEAMFGEPVTYIGFPTLDGSVGCVMNADSGYCIVEKSEKKDAAWEFIEFYLNRENSLFSWGLPSRKEKLEELIAKESKVEYVTDENGEIMKDENGDPIISGMGGFGWNDWEYTYHPCTEEEMAVLWELIEIARPMRTTNSEVLKIIAEEAEAFYKGQKSMDEVVGTIQSRVSMYVGENS